MIVSMKRHSVLEPTPVARTLPRPRRMEYRRMVRGALRRALVDFDVQGRPHFADLEFPEVRWVPFTPSEEELEAVYRELELAGELGQMTLESDLVFQTGGRPLGPPSEVWLG